MSLSVVLLRPRGVLRLCQVLLFLPVCSYTQHAIPQALSVHTRNPPSSLKEFVFSFVYCVFVCVRVHVFVVRTDEYVTPPSVFVQFVRRGISSTHDSVLFAPVRRIASASLFMGARKLTRQMCFLFTLDVDFDVKTFRRSLFSSLLLDYRRSVLSLSVL